jgi:cold shock CspA family protein
MRGIIRKWNWRHGFIEPASGSEPSVFVHMADLPAPLRLRGVKLEGLEVDYEQDNTDERGPRAANVKVIR